MIEGTSGQRRGSREPGETRPSPKSLSFGDSTPKPTPLSKRLQLKSYQTASPNAETSRSTASQFSTGFHKRKSAAPILSNSGRLPSFIELRTKSHDGVREFAPIRAFLDPSFTEFGNILRETFKILDLLQHNLSQLGISPSDLFLISISVSDDTISSTVADTVSFYFGDQLSSCEITVETKPIPDSCSVQIEARAKEQVPAFTNPTPSQPQPQANSISARSPHALSSQRLEIMSTSSYLMHDNKWMNICFAFGDLLPVTVAQAFGFYGEAAERLESAIKLVNFFRLLICLFCLFIFIPLLNFLLARNESESLRLRKLYNSTIYITVVASILFVENVALAVFGIWFGKNQSLSIKLYAYVSYYGDIVFFVLLLSALSSVLPLISVIITADQDDLVRAQYDRSRSFSIATLLFFVPCFYLSRKIFYWYCKYGERITFSILGTEDNGGTSIENQITQ